MSMKHGKYQRHEGAVERKLDEIIELLKIQTKVLTGLAFAQMMEDEE